MNCTYTHRLNSSGTPQHSMSFIQEHNEQQLTVPAIYTRVILKTLYHKYPIYLSISEFNKGKN